MAQDCKMFLSIVKSPVQKSGAGVRLIHRSMFGSVQLKNLWLKSLTTPRAVSQLKVELQFAIKFSYFREFWKSTKVQFIGQKLNFNFCPTHGLTFLSCNSNEVQRERSGPL